MMQCRVCGAILLDNAQYCMQCGTAVATSDGSHTGSSQKLDCFQAALAAGVDLVRFSALPIIALGNYFCCMWVVGGGALSSYLLLKQRSTGISYGDGAFGGVLSGLVGAVVATF